MLLGAPQRMQCSFVLSFKTWVVVDDDAQQVVPLGVLDLPGSHDNLSSVQMLLHQYFDWSAGAQGDAQWRSVRLTTVPDCLTVSLIQGAYHAGTGQTTRNKTTRMTM